MLGKRRLIVLIALVAVSFAASFVISMLLGGGAEPLDARVRSESAPPTGSLLAKLAAGGLGEMKPREKELEELIKEVRHKIDVCRQKERELQKQQQRIQIAQDQLKAQAQELENLRIQLVAPLARLKEAHVRLKRSRILIVQQERTNLKKIAGLYEKMDSSSAADRLTAMCENKQSADVVKILFFMSARSAGKVLAEISDRKLVARLCEQMKRIQQEGQ